MNSSSKIDPIASDAAPAHAPHKRPPLWKDALRLIGGLGVTLRYLIAPKRVVTREYPENRDELQMTQRFRGMVIMPHDDAGEHNCTGCTLCERACPNGTISILNTKNHAGRRVLGKFIYRFEQCTLCNLCIEACPFDAIRMGQQFEMASFKRSELILVLNEKEGRG